MKPIMVLKLKKEDPIGLEKFLTQDIAEGTFDNLLNYLTSPEADAVNQQYDHDRRALAARVIDWSRDLRANPNGGSFDLRYLDSSGNYSDAISLDSRVSEYLGNMLKTKTAQVNGETVQFQQGDLVLRYNPVGG